MTCAATISTYIGTTYLSALKHRRLFRRLHAFLLDQNNLSHAFYFPFRQPVLSPFYHHCFHLDQKEKLYNQSIVHFCWFIHSFNTQPKFANQRFCFCFLILDCYLSLNNGTYRCNWNSCHICDNRLILDRNVSLLFLSFFNIKF